MIRSSDGAREVNKRQETVKGSRSRDTWDIGPGKVRKLGHHVPPSGLFIQ